ncbi:transglycosylase domain-containing protein [Streptomyces sp. MP131-18]|uniref:transglycosylase domain-containing protein n=1 Tax=Streptomyces sp. MP131-18 TaxID=1857892 RepID=UPI0009A2152E|nr:transglycosylase domain-containing protein [Streptomyces sp. MP131-18]ONK14001.1 Penicillin-binding protein 1* [Streptomyces sp. MP131-18]
MSDESEPPRGAGRWPGWPSKSAGAPPRPPRRRRTGWRRLIPTWRVVLAGSLVGVLAVFAALITGYLLVDIPEPKSAAAAQGNVYLYADGSQLARVGEVNRENVPLSQVPEAVRRAVLAAEDRDFYHDPAVDVTAMVRAGWNMLRGGGRQSGSTITQQYVKNYYLDQRQTVTRKVKELFISVKLGREVSKDEILEGYLNTSYFGRNAYGIQSAAQAYYGKDATDLTTAEGAYLAALLNAPNSYDVRANPQNAERAVARWEYVLDGMVSEDWLAERKRARMRFPEPREITGGSGLAGERGYLVEAVNTHLAERGIADEEQLAQGGYRITTTIEPERQRALTDAVETQLESALSEDREQDAWVRAGATSVEGDTGRVVAMYGGRDFTRQYVNNATRRDYQAASTFKPFVYAAALEHDAETHDGERIGPDTEYDGDSGREVVGRDGRGTGWSPHNEGQEDYGEISVTEGMDKSVNAVFAQLGADVGPGRVRETAVALGIPESTPGLDTAEGSISLGTATPSTLDLAQAYATLAAHGEHRPVTLVDEVRRSGQQVRLPRTRPERVLSREAADGTAAVLRSVVSGGTGTAARSAGRPAAGKTGTAEEDKAAWFAGFTPELTTVVAVFGQDPVTGEQRPLYGAAGQERISGGGFPARIWGQYTAEALRDEPVRDFDLDGGEPVPEVTPGGPPGEDGSDVPGQGGTAPPGGREEREDPRERDGGGEPSGPPSPEPAEPTASAPEPEPESSAAPAASAGPPPDGSGGGRAPGLATAETPTASAAQQTQETQQTPQERESPAETGSGSEVQR